MVDKDTFLHSGKWGWKHSAVSCLRHSLFSPAYKLLDHYQTTFLLSSSPQHKAWFHTRSQEIPIARDTYSERLNTYSGQEPLWFCYKRGRQWAAVSTVIQCLSPKGYGIWSLVVSTHPLEQTKLNTDLMAMPIQNFHFMLGRRGSLFMTWSYFSVPTLIDLIWSKLAAAALENRQSLLPSCCLFISGIWSSALFCSPVLALFPPSLPLGIHSETILLIWGVLAYTTSSYSPGSLSTALIPLLPSPCQSSENTSHTG